MVEKPGEAPKKKTFSERLKDLKATLKPAADELKEAGQHVKKGVKNAWDKTEPKRTELKKKGGEMLEKGKKKGSEIVEEGKKKGSEIVEEGRRKLKKLKDAFTEKETPKKKD